MSAGAAAAAPRRSLAWTTPDSSRSCAARWTAPPPCGRWSKVFLSLTGSGHESGDLASAGTEVAV
ncbi:hypothetical protein DLE01_14290 [Streptomyces sp. FT05W]|nr:hypothetical protein DLE01_14290 [Streptomyces sp. FT05W]